MALTSSVRFPGESPAYRNARDKLLAAEIELRARVEEVAALRRALPPGGAVPEDYVFEEGERQVKLSDLFRIPDASLAVYSFMYGPAMEKACPMCTAMLDSLDGTAPHAAQRINLVVVAKSPIARIRAFARERGWRNLRLVSSAGNTYNSDYHGESADGSQMPFLNVFTRRGGVTRHVYGTELLFAPPAPGQNNRHVDAIWPLWNLFDFTPDGRGSDWYPRLEYPASGRKDGARNMQRTRQRELMDRDHAALASIVAQIRRASDAENFRLTRQLLLDLQALEETHYASEDALMRAAGYDMLARHQAEHAQLINTLRSINQTILVENLRSVSPRIAAHLETALEHMHKSDSEFWAMPA